VLAVASKDASKEILNTRRPLVRELRVDAVVTDDRLPGAALCCEHTFAHIDQCCQAIKDLLIDIHVLFFLTIK
jgi:hypothetical protein